MSCVSKDGDSMLSNRVPLFLHLQSSTVEVESSNKEKIIWANTRVPLQLTSYNCWVDPRPLKTGAS